MASHRFHLVNVFVAGSALSGNALCVFEDGSALPDETMQALALQFNLSETTFLGPSAVATARVRIFTPAYEMPFAGHPTLGSAHIVRAVRGGGDAVTLEMRAGVIPVRAAGDVWTLEANAPRVRPCEATRAQVAAMLGLGEGGERDLLDGLQWVDTGSEQLVIPLASPGAVDRCRPDAALLATYGANARREGHAYVWARDGAGRVVARFFFLKRGEVVEDPGTGSACANLGGWLVATGAAVPVELTVAQGAHTGRPCRLGLRVDEARRIFVTGRVVAVATGEVTI